MIDEPYRYPMGEAPELARVRSDEDRSLSHTLAVVRQAVGARSG
jgi:hypothetical protein